MLADTHTHRFTYTYKLLIECDISSLSLTHTLPLSLLQKVSGCLPKPKVMGYGVGHLIFYEKGLPGETCPKGASGSGVHTGKIRGHWPPGCGHMPIKDIKGTGVERACLDIAVHKT